MMDDNDPLETNYSFCPLHSGEQLAFCRLAQVRAAYETARDSHGMSSACDHACDCS